MTNAEKTQAEAPRLRNQAVYDAHEAFRRARAAYDSLPGDAPETEHGAKGHAKDEAATAFMLTPCKIEWALFEKFQILESEGLHPDYFIGPACVRLWLAAMKSDAIWLADAWEKSRRENERLERDLARIRDIWRGVSHPEAEEAMSAMEAAEPVN